MNGPPQQARQQSTWSSTPPHMSRPELGSVAKSWRACQWALFAAHFSSTLVRLLPPRQQQQQCDLALGRQQPGTLNDAVRSSDRPKQRQPSRRSWAREMERSSKAYMLYAGDIIIPQPHTRELALHRPTPRSTRPNMSRMCEIRICRARCWTFARTRPHRAPSGRWLHMWHVRAHDSSRCTERIQTKNEFFVCMPLGRV